MITVSINFQKIDFKPFKQDIGYFLKGCDKIIHWPYKWHLQQKKICKQTLNSSGPSIEPCGTPNIISNQVL